MPARNIIEDHSADDEADDDYSSSEKRRCPYCVGGKVPLEPGSTTGHRCPDCHGTCVIPFEEGE